MGRSAPLRGWEEEKVGTRRVGRGVVRQVKKINFGTSVDVHRRRRGSCSPSLTSLLFFLCCLEKQIHECMLARVGGEEGC